MQKSAVVLLSGGLDSTVALFLAKREGYQIHALAFSYGQRHSKELECARWQADKAEVATFRVVDLSFASWGGSALTDSTIDIEEGDIHREVTPNTYVPARNMVFLSVAASVAEAVQAEAIYIGVSEVDYSGYVDCRAEFIAAMEHAINKGTERKYMNGRPIEIRAPFVHTRKRDEILLGLELGVDFSHTWTCYHGGEHPCGQCDSCKLRANAFHEAGAIDPLQ